MFIFSCSVDESESYDEGDFVDEITTTTEIVDNLDGFAEEFDPNDPFGEIQVLKSGGKSIKHYLIVTYGRLRTWKWKPEKTLRRRLRQGLKKVSIPVYEDDTHGPKTVKQPYQNFWEKRWNRNGDLGFDKDYTDEKEVTLNSITFKHSSATDLLNGDTRTLKPVFKTTPKDAAVDKSVTWTSDDPSVATVDSNGKVTAKSLGSVTITAESKKEFKNGKMEGKITLNVANFNVSMRVYIPELPVDRSDLSKGYRDYVDSPLYGTFPVDGENGYRVKSTAEISFKGEDKPKKFTQKSVEFYNFYLDPIDFNDYPFENNRLKKAAIDEKNKKQDGKKGYYVKAVKTLLVDDAGFDNKITKNDLSTHTLIYQVKASASNPLAYSPRIDYNLKIIIQQSPEGYYYVRLSGTHDGFPNYELKIRGKYLYNFVTQSNPLSLFGDSDQSASPSAITIKENKKAIKEKINIDTKWVKIQW